MRLKMKLLKNAWSPNRLHKWSEKTMDGPFKAKKDSQHVCLQIRCHSTGLKHDFATKSTDPWHKDPPITMAHHPKAHSSEISVVAVPSA